MDNPGDRSLKTGYLCAFSCTFFSALMIVLIKWLIGSLPALSLIFMMQGVAGLVLSVIVFRQGAVSARLRAVSLKGWLSLAGIASLTFFGYWTFFLAIERLDPTVASFISRIETLVTILIGMAFLGERLGRREAAGGCLVIAGVVLVRYVAGIKLSDGLFLSLVSAVLWGTSEGLAKIVVRSVPPILFTWGRSVLLCPAYLIAAACSGDGVVIPAAPGVWLGVVCVAVSGPVLGRFFYMKSLSLIPVTKTALIMQLQPLWVALTAALALGNTPSLRECAGGVLIVAGCMVLVKKPA